MRTFHSIMANIFIRLANYHFDRSHWRDVLKQPAQEADMFWPMLEKDVYVSNGNKLN